MGLPKVPAVGYDGVHKWDHAGRTHIVQILVFYASNHLNSLQFMHLEDNGKLHTSEIVGSLNRKADMLDVGSKYVKYNADLHTVSPCSIWICRLEIYQKTLVKALVTYFRARLLVVDDILLPGGSSQKESDNARENVKTQKPFYMKRASIIASLRHKKPASSVDADIASASSLSQP